MRNVQISFLASLAACASASTLAAAQTTAAVAAPESEAQAASIDEVVVTARKRSESVQDVPISISVTSGATLQKAAIADLDGLKSLTSGLTMRRSANQITVPTLRGLGTGTSSETFEQSIAGFLDGTYIGRSPEMNAGIFDLERVEIIKGTQAALLAKNTSLGAISMVTRKPELGFDYNLSAGYEFELGSHLIEGGISVPLSGTLAVRVSGLTRRQDGWVKNSITGENGPHGAADAGRIVARWTPNDRIDATVLYQHFKTETRGNGVEFLADVLGVGRRLALAGGNPNFETRLDYRNFSTNAGFDEAEETKGDRVIATVNYEVGDFTVTSVSAYSTFDQRVDGDKDFNSGTYVTQLSALDNEQFSQELRLTSPVDKPINYVLGVYYQHEVFGYKRSSFLSPVLALNGAFSDGVKISTDTYSAFGQANYRFGEGFTASAGVRVTDEKRTGDYTDRIYSTPGTVRALYPPFAAASVDIGATNIDGSVGLQYQKGGALYYISAARGTKGGTFLSAPSTPLTSTIPSEEATTFEAGAKWTFDRGVFNATLFNTKIKDLQQASFNGSVFLTDPRDVRSYGFEADMSYRLNDELRFSGSVTYAHARQIADAAHPGDNSRVVNAPLWSGRVGLDYQRDLGKTYRMSANLGAEYRSEVIFVPESQTRGYGANPTVAVVPSGKEAIRVNARIGFGARSQKWEIALVGRNLTNETTLAYALPGAFQAGTAVGTADLPRTIMMQLNLRY